MGLTGDRSVCLFTASAAGRAAVPARPVQRRPLGGQGRRVPRGPRFEEGHGAGQGCRGWARGYARSWARGCRAGGGARAAGLRMDADGSLHLTRTPPSPHPYPARPCSFVTCSGPGPGAAAGGQRLVQDPDRRDSRLHERSRHGRRHRLPQYVRRTSPLHCGVNGTLLGAASPGLAELSYSLRLPCLCLLSAPRPALSLPSVGPRLCPVPAFSRPLGLPCPCVLSVPRRALVPAFSRPFGLPCPCLLSVPRPLSLPYFGRFQTNCACAAPPAERELVLTPIRQLLPRADIPNRRPREQWWSPLGRVLRLLASYD